MDGMSSNLSRAYNVTFVCDYMVVMVTVDLESELTDERIARIAGEYVEGNYGFNPHELAYDYEVNEV